MESAFTAYQPQRAAEQGVPPKSCRSHPHGNPTLALTRGISGLVGSGAAGGGAVLAGPAAQPLTLPDGRLNAGTPLGLLAGRYRYLSRVAEGVSSQVVSSQPGRLARFTPCWPPLHLQTTRSSWQRSQAMRRQRHQPVGWKQGCNNPASVLT